MSFVSKKLNISAFFFLSIFSVYLLHHLIPHIHHEHGHVEFADHTSITKVEHHHDHDHHHNHNHDDDTSERFDLLEFLFGAHVHTAQIDNILVAKRNINEQITVKTVLTKVAYAIKIRERQTEEQKVFQHPPDPTKSPHITSVSLRGPPSLG